jgi:hypothetical protein
VALVYRPWNGRFGALKADVGLGAGLVIPMMLRPPAACSPSNPGACAPQPQLLMESTYRQNGDGGAMRRVGYARPPLTAGGDVRVGYLFEISYVQVEAALQGMVRYSAIFYTAREGFGKRNRCCDRGYYDRATNLDVYVGPVLTARLSL